MYSPEGSSPGATVIAASQNEPFRLRSYQAEMVEESMKSNIIVVMDTGSGKTHIAIERTRAELETCHPHKLVWFLAPTVALCEQQYEVFQSNLPGFGYQILCGRNDINLWTKQSDWDAVLHNVRIVLSTHQVLLDALTHGFFKMSKLALLIFDEAHHCTLKHAAHRIMSDFYMPQVETGCSELPKILGLSASPVMKAKATTQDLQQIEQNLSATVKTPKLHHSELVRHVHRPELFQIDYPSELPDNERSHLLLALKQAYISYDLMTDPDVIKLLKQQQSGYDVSKQLQKLWVSQKTYCNKQLKTLVSKAEAMAEELGTSATEWFLQQCIAQFEKTTRVSDQQLLDWSGDEKLHLLNILRRLPFPNTSHSPSDILANISRKVEILVNTLVAEATDNPGFTGLVFIEQRVWVAALAEILSVHPRTRDLLRIGTFLGSSQFDKRKSNISSFAEPRNQQSTLEEFRAGNLNLILATSVLEEGIDVSSCHLVVCFERPTNLKSFIQRRGRARKQQSKYFIFTPDTEAARSPESWQSLEAQMREAYENDLRHAKAAEEREEIDEDGQRHFRVLSTGALLTLDNASQHLHHFCALLGSGAYINTRPQFEFIKTASGLTTAKVMLPISVDPTVRTAKSLESWRTERMAQKDVAFEAYKSLHLAGLVNENLLPAREEADNQASQFQIPDNRPSFVPVSPTLDPWPMVAQHYQDNPHVWFRTLLEVSAPGEGPIRMVLLTPISMAAMPETLLYWNKTMRYTVEYSLLPGTNLSDDEIQILRSITCRILQSVLPGHVAKDKDDFLWLLAPCDPLGCIMNIAQLREWDASNTGYRSVSEILTQGDHDAANWGIITQQGDLRKYMPKALRVPQNQVSPGLREAQVYAVRLPKRKDFLHPVYGITNENDAYTRVETLPASQCIVDNLPTPYSILALLLPSILHRFEVCMVADILRTTHLKPLSFEGSNLPIIETALTASSADDENNYQRLEFLGDCILKFIASLHLMADNLIQSESFLTGKKGRIISNGFLARANLAAGIDQFIITKRFTGAKWKPRYVEQTLADKPPPVKLQKSSKLVADIIESLIGASYVIGGFPKAFICVQTLLPLENWTPIPDANRILHDIAPTQCTIMNLDVVEELIGHTFTKKALLLEALTHASFIGINVHCSYERLEFLGDAVLDYIVSRRLYAHKPKISHRQMHAVRTAMVNASFLTYSMLETEVPEVLTNKATLQPETHLRTLWQFLRSSSPQLIASRDVALAQHADARTQIAAALAKDARYPWHVLSLTDPPKFLSDIVESIMGAIYVDSHGDIPACEAFFRRLGIFSALDRILRDSVDCLHPKERLGHLAVEKGVEYVRITDEQENVLGDKNVYRCQVRVGGQDVGGVVEGLKRLNTETIAAWRASGVLEEGGGVVMEESEGGEVFHDADEYGGAILED
ncbi:hypothetical protein EJ02DRAFT_369929 [Clathrospora elynae]|uniref:P-loop containing nucleoside triphosphate hydrolase protein n=1 Tax=Clathrospora elynae TaxID=706981 RepID=A0A6A5SYV7_9PLEO|nr:hypothetical protein EJ02DRAFT_369929 [Clathrospora elynae]